jgi:hypothetical protein
MVLPATTERSIQARTYARGSSLSAMSPGLTDSNQHEVARLGGSVVR